MSVVWKYELGEVPYSTVEMPGGARLLDVGVQGNVPVVWALVDPDRDKEPRCFQHIGTGHSFPLKSDLSYVGSYQLDLPGGVFVGHLWEVGAAA